MQGRPKFLSAEQFLLTTLVVKLAVMAALATMLVRYRRFRHILIFERRAWPDRLVFALEPRHPAGRRRRRRGCCCDYNAADLTLEGAFLAGLIAGPYAGAHRRRSWSASRRSAPASSSPLPFAVGCGFAGGGLRELCPKEAIWHFSPFVFTGLHRRAWQMLRTLRRSTGRSCCCSRRSRSSCCGRGSARAGRRPTACSTSRPELAVDDGRRAARDGAVRRDADQDLEQRAHRAPAAGAGEAAARGEDRGAREPDQPALPVQHADVDLLAHPHAAGDGAHAHHEAVGPAAPAAAQHGSLRHAARGARVDRRVPRHRGRPLRPAAQGRQADQPRHARRHRAEHDPAAARRELDQARAVAQGRRRPHHDPQRAARRPRDHRGATTTGSA